MPLNYQVQDDIFSSLFKEKEVFYGLYFLFLIYYKKVSLFFTVFLFTSSIKSFVFVTVVHMNLFLKGNCFICGTVSFSTFLPVFLEVIT